MTLYFGGSPLTDSREVLTEQEYRRIQITRMTENTDIKRRHHLAECARLEAMSENIKLVSELRAIAAAFRWAR